MYVQFRFGPGSNLQALGKTTLADEAGDAAEIDSWQTAKVVVYPGDTERFVKGV